MLVWGFGFLTAQTPVIYLMKGRIKLVKVKGAIALRKNRKSLDDIVGILLV